MAPAEALVLPPHLSKQLFRSSFLATSSIAAALYNGQHDCACLAALVFCTSVNYWRHPVLGWRRNVDMVSAMGSLAYQLFVVCPGAPVGGQAAYWALTAAGCGCYIGARHFSFTRQSKAAGCAWHSCVHFFGNLSNIVLYDSLGRNHLGWA